MTMQLIIGNCNYSTWSMRPWLYAHYHQLPIDIVGMNLFSDELLAKLEGHFSNGKVPLLLDGDIEVWDSIAILEYFGEKFPQTDPWPATAAARAAARSVSAEMHSSFTALRNEAPMNCRKRFPGYKLSAQARGDVDRIQSLWRYCRQNFGRQGPWLFGRFSIADAMYAPVVMRFRSIDVELGDIARSYCQTVNDCPSVKQWISNGLGESYIVTEDELDFPGEQLTC